MRYKLIAAALIAVTYHACGVCAADPDQPVFSFNGFGTLGAVHSSEADADLVANFFQPNGAGFTRAWSASVDSKLGLQMDVHLNDRISATLQVAAQHRYDNHYMPQVEWANVKYQFTPDLSVRLGRTVTSFFSVSDSGLVSYTQPWVRPPLELYAQLPIKHKDGIDALYRFKFGEVTSSLDASYGQFDSKLPAGGETRETHFFDISETVEYGAASMRFGYGSLRIAVSDPGLTSLFGGFTQFGNVLAAIPGLQANAAQAFAIADRYPIENIPYSLITVGATYDPGTWLLMGEWVRADGSGSIPNSTAWYVTGGYRIGAFTPYLTLSRAVAATPSEPGISTAGLPPQLAVATAGLNAGLAAALNAFTRSQQTTSAGIRWDFMRNMALKLQFERLNTLAGSTGFLANVQPGFRPGEHLNVFSATIDFVF